MAAVLIALLACAGATYAQTLDERLDEDKFLRGLSDYQLPEVLEQYISMNPAGDPVKTALYQIAADLVRRNNRDLGTAERIAIQEQILVRRQTLIDEHPFDPRHAVWLGDQATDLLFGLLPMEATELTSLFGLPSPPQLRRAQRVAAEVNALADEAELEIAETILNLEGEPDYRDDIALQLQRRRLARDQRDRRIPFLRGVGAFLHAEFNVTDQDERRALYTLAVEYLTPLADLLEGFLRTRAQLYTGLAWARLGDDDAATAIFDAITADDASDPADVFASRMGGIMSRSVARGPQAALDGLRSIEEKYTGPSDVFFRVLLTDRRFLLRREMALAAPEAERAGLLKHAFDAYADLMQADLGVGQDTMRSIVFAKLANAADENTPLESLPPIAAVARAENLARDESTRDEAIDLFIVCLQRDDLDERAKAAAIFGLARALYERRDWLDAAYRFDQLAREHPTDPQAERAVRIAVTLLDDLHAKAPTASAVRVQYAASLTLLLTRYPNLSDLWTWQWKSGVLELEQGRYDAAEQVLSNIPPGAPVWLDSRYMLVRIAHDRAEGVQDAAAREGAMRALLLLCDTTRRTLAGRAVSLRDEERVATIHDLYLPAIDLYEADAHLALGDPDAALVSLEAADGASVDREVLGRVLAARIKAYQASGQSDAAQREVRRFMDSIPEQVADTVPAMLAALLADVERLIELDRPAEALAQSQEQLMPLARAMQEWMGVNRLPPQETLAISLQIADAYRHSGDHGEALTLYDQLAAANPTALQVLFGRAECLFGLSQWADAVVIYKRISADRKQAKDAYFWQAELNTLWCLFQRQRELRVAGDAAQADRIVRRIQPHIGELRANDPTFGGPRFQRGFNELSNTLLNDGGR